MPRTPASVASREAQDHASKFICAGCNARATIWRGRIKVIHYALCPAWESFVSRHPLFVKRWLA